MSEPSVPRALPAILALALALAACSGGAASTEPSPSSPAASVEPSAEPSTTPSFVVMAIGDSIPYNASEDCPGCIGFVDSYAEALQAALGEPVAVINRSRHDGARAADIVEQLESSQPFLDELASADVVLVSVGFNDQPPFADAHEGCPDPVSDADPLSVVAERGAATSRACVDAVVPLIRDQVAAVLAGVRAQAPDARIGVLTAYDSWLGWSALDSLDEATRTDLYAAVRYWMHAWRDALCAAADDVGAVCVDLYAAFNGVDGTQPPTDFVAADYTHPSQAGNDLIRDLLLEASLVD